MLSMPKERNVLVVSLFQITPFFFGKRKTLDLKIFKRKLNPKEVSNHSKTVYEPVFLRSSVRKEVCGIGLEVALSCAQRLPIYCQLHSE